MHPMLTFENRWPHKSQNNAHDSKSKAHLDEGLQLLANRGNGLSLGFANLSLQALQRLASLGNGFATSSNCLQLYAESVN